MSMRDDWLEMEKYLAGLDDKPEWSDYEPEKKVRIPSCYEEGLYSHQYWEEESDEPDRRGHQKAVDDGEQHVCDTERTEGGTGE